MAGDYKNLSVLVTGGAGFIGSNLVDALLAAGARVRVLDSFATGHRQNLAHVADRIELVEGDIRDKAACDAAVKGVKVVFHQAALGSVPRSMEDPGTSIDVNVGGTTRIFQAARDAKVSRIVYASSSSVFGDSEILPKKEGQEGKLLSPYAMSKAMNETIGEVFLRCYGLESVGLRYFNVYGARQDPNGAYAAVVPRFFAAIGAGKAPTIYGDGKQSRDFTYVGDAVQANMKAAFAPKEACGQGYNIGTGETTSVTDLARLIAETLGSKLEPQYQPPRAGDVLHSRADCSRAKAAFGYVPQVLIAEGIDKAKAWYTR